MTSVKYSICATHYNNLEYLQESVGVFADLISDRPDTELVVVDGGSTDGSLDYLTELSESQETSA